MRPTRTTRRGLRALTLALATLVLAGCVRVQMDLELEPDDTVDGFVILAFSDDLAAVVDPQTVLEDLGTPQAAMPESSTSEPYAEDGYQGTKTTFHDTPFAEMTVLDDEDALRITRDGDEIVVTGVMDMTGSGSPMGELGATLGNGLDFRIAITFPRDVIEHNGRLTGRTVVWEPRAGERTEISARGVAARAGTPADGTGDSGDAGAGSGSDGAAGGGEADDGTASASSAAGTVSRGAIGWLPFALGAVVLGGLAVLLVVVLVARARRPQPVDAGVAASSPAQQPGPGPAPYPYPAPPGRGSAPNPYQAPPAYQAPTSEGTVPPAPAPPSSDEPRDPTA